MNSLRTMSIAIGLTAAFSCVPSFAGSVSGPYLIWFNLAEDHGADAAIHDYTHTYDDDLDHFQGTPLEGCWNSDARLLITGYPSEITNSLVRAAVIQRDDVAAKQLAKALYGNGGYDNYDGIVLIVHSPKPTVISFSAKGRIKSKVAIDKSGTPDWPAAFCAVLPPISRKP